MYLLRNWSSAESHSKEEGAARAGPPVRARRQRAVARGHKRRAAQGQLVRGHVRRRRLGRAGVREARQGSRQGLPPREDEEEARRLPRRRRRPRLELDQVRRLGRRRLSLRRSRDVHPAPGPLGEGPEAHEGRVERAADLDVVGGDPLRRADARGVVGLAEGAVGVAPRRDVVRGLAVELAERVAAGARAELAQVRQQLARGVQRVAAHADLEQRRGRAERVRVVRERRVGREGGGRVPGPGERRAAVARQREDLVREVVGPVRGEEEPREGPAPRDVRRAARRALEGDQVRLRGEAQAPEELGEVQALVDAAARDVAPERGHGRRRPGAPGRQERPGRAQLAAQVERAQVRHRVLAPPRRRLPLTEERVVRLGRGGPLDGPQRPRAGRPVAQLRREALQIQVLGEVLAALHPEAVPDVDGVPRRDRLVRPAGRLGRHRRERRRRRRRLGVHGGRVARRRRGGDRDRAVRVDRLEREPGGARGRVGRRAAPRGEPGEHSAGRPHALQDSQVVVRVCRASGSSTHSRVGGALVFEMHSNNDCHTLRSCPGWRP